MSRAERRVLAILPTYNEKDNILPLFEELLAVSDLLDVLVVDDGSPDGTGDIVAEAQVSNPRIHLLRRNEKLGLGTAYLAGFLHGLDGVRDESITWVCRRLRSAVPRASSESSNRC